MRFFIDCEFIERGHRYPIELISIGILSEDDREYYAISTEFNPQHASQWVKDNVIACLPPRHAIHPMNGGGSPREWEESKAWKPLAQIRDEVAGFTGCQKSTGFIVSDRFKLENQLRRLLRLPQKMEATIGFEVVNDRPESWGEWSSYDHVVFCQIFGTMMDLPKGFPMLTLDVLQWAHHLSVSVDQLPASFETEGNHNALLGAKTVKRRWEYLSLIDPGFNPTQFMDKVAKGLGAEVILP